MSTAPKRPLAEMLPIAEAIRDEMAPLCERIEIAGSIRRKCAEVSDIEIVAVPKMREGERSDLFMPAESVDCLDEHLQWLVEGPAGVRPRLDINGRKALGPRYKRLLWTSAISSAVGFRDDVAVDLFAVLPPASWGVILALRTGPAEFSRRLVTQRSKGGLLRDAAEVRDGTLWVLGVPRDCEDEDAFFADGCRLDWIAPEDR